MAKANPMAKLYVKRREVHSAIFQEELQSYTAKGLDVKTGKETALALSEDC